MPAAGRKRITCGFKPFVSHLTHEEPGGQAAVGKARQFDKQRGLGVLGAQILPAWEPRSPPERRNPRVLGILSVKSCQMRAAGTDYDLQNKR